MFFQGVFFVIFFSKSTQLVGFFGRNKFGFNFLGWSKVGGLARISKKHPLKGGPFLTDRYKWSYK